MLRLESRVLPAQEWGRLSGTLLAEASKRLNPSVARVIAIEDRGALVACSSLFPAWHLEGTWIDPAYRGNIAVGRRLLRAMRAAVVDVGAGEVLMMATTPATSRLCRKLGHATFLDAEHFAVVMEGL